VFVTYLKLGFTHIADLSGYDHILFIIALCAIYRIEEWKKVAILVTAFTLGHSLTLALAALDVIPLNQAWIEFLIPLTILATALYNVVADPHSREGSPQLFGARMQGNYWIALLFGLIHGMGFSNFFRATLMPGEESQLVLQLLAFNLGVELGQLCIVGFVLLASFLAFRLFRIQVREWNLFISGGAASLALVMALERIPF
jgi:hypothetical protein